MNLLAISWKSKINKKPPQQGFCVQNRRAQRRAHSKVLLNMHKVMIMV